MCSSHNTTLQDRPVKQTSPGRSNATTWYPAFRASSRVPRLAQVSDVKLAPCRNTIAGGSVWSEKKVALKLNQRERGQHTCPMLAAACSRRLCHCHVHHVCTCIYLSWQICHRRNTSYDFLILGKSTCDLSFASKHAWVDVRA